MDYIGLLFFIEMDNFFIPREISNNCAELLNVSPGSKLIGGYIVSTICQYIKRNKLAHAELCQFFEVDSYLEKLLKYPTGSLIRYSFLPNIVNKMFV